MEEKKSKKNKWTRRAFMIAGGVAGTGLLVGIGGLIHVNQTIRYYSGKGLGEGSSLNAWIRIAPDNTITLAIPRVEMGQGSYTGLAMMIAEELEVDMESIRIVHPQPESPYANLFIFAQSETNIFDGYSINEKLFSYLNLVITGGSSSITDGYYNMRYAGATAREMLKKAAAQQWKTDVKNCKAESGFIINQGNQEKLSYGELASAAAKIKVSSTPELKNRKDWKKVGKPVKRLDIPEKVQGKATFGIDVRPENVLYAAFRHPSVLGAKITGFKNKADIEKQAGIKKVVLTEFGAAVIADNTWRAKNAALALQVIEDEKESVKISTASIGKELDILLKKPAFAEHEKEGDVDKVLAEKQKTIIQAQYEVPYLAHATMEPLNCTVLVKDDAVDVWLGHQASSTVRNAVSKVSKMDASKIMIHMQYLGGGFGRRGEADFVKIATAVAMQMKGTPVMTVFTREEDMRNDVYRPAVKCEFKALVQKDGTIEAWDHKLALQSVVHETMKRAEPPLSISVKDDTATTEGARELPYEMKNRRVSFGNLVVPVKVGFWRSVGSSQNAFFTECFMDECAHAAGIDPYQFRLSKLDKAPRFKKVLQKVAEMSHWNKALAKDRYRGIALHKCFGSIVGQVVEITKLGEKEFSIDKFYCVVDCGTYINPDSVKAQMESGIIFGLSAALFGEITWQDGKVQQSNFPQYDMIRLKASPEIETYIIENEEFPGGVGEPGTPPAAPALANALFAATGVRERSLPLVKLGYKFV
ncbi:MAG: molybdopterin cofactor-binding domain-containing protein [Microscillaceae bacterium]|nr:molybdopterin cofactor-binding domain-containing protein [Microscillaceae bacterium]